jgi:hypothetical protein
MSCLNNFDGAYLLVLQQRLGHIDQSELCKIHSSDDLFPNKKKLF